MIISVCIFIYEVVFHSLSYCTNISVYFLNFRNKFFFTKVFKLDGHSESHKGIISEV